MRPDVLYHATYRDYLTSILEHGLGGLIIQKNWEDSREGVVYLAVNPDIARSYAENSEFLEELSEEEHDRWIKGIIVLEVDILSLDTRLSTDVNVIDNDGSTLEYHGVIPAGAIRNLDCCQDSGPDTTS